MSTAMSLLAKLGLDTSDFQKGISEASQGATGLSGILSTAMKGGLAPVAAIGAAAVATGAAIVKLAADAAPLQGISDAFAGISGNADVMLETLRKGSLSMVSDKDLMLSYNSAAQLVSKTFADQLPEAMQYLTKISAATGEDMNYLLDSLVKGVGRVNPAILDNLKIQVDVSEATAAASAQFGIEADALSKTQIQAGMMSVVLQKLEENTANMPEVAGTASQQMAALGVTFHNLKDQVGLMLIPVLQALLTPLLELATTVVPKVIGAVKWAMDNLQIVIPVIVGVGTAIVVTALPAITAMIAGLVAWASAAIASAAATAAAMAPVVLPILAIAAVVAFLLTAWKRDWGGIQTHVTEVWDNSIRPTIEAGMQFISSVIEAGLAFLQNLWQVVLMVLQGDWRAAWERIQEIASTVWEALQAYIQLAIENVKLVLSEAMDVIKLVWQLAWEMIYRRLSEIWDDVKKKVGDTIEAVQTKISEVLDDVSTAWGEKWDAIQTKVGEIWTAISTGVSSKIREVYDTVTTKIEEARQWISDQVGNWRTVGAAIISGLIDGVRSRVGDLIRAATSAVSDAIAAAKALLHIACPDPSPVTRDIGIGMAEGLIQGILSARGSVMSAMGQVVNSATTGAGLGPGTVPVSGSQSRVEYHFHLAANYAYQSETTLAQDVRMLQMINQPVR